MSATLPLPRRLVIATRESALAMWQAEHVRGQLRSRHPSCEVTLLGITTQGDRVVDRPLADIGGKGLFIKELEQAMADGRADLAVHSLKDVPMEMPPGFVLAAIMKREDPRDAWVSNRFPSIAALPAKSVVGTSSLRREAQLRERYPGIDVVPLRGNVNTRLKKLDDGQYAAIILAAAGLKRLGFADRIAALLDPGDSLPAVGQGRWRWNVAPIAPTSSRHSLRSLTARRRLRRPPSVPSACASAEVATRRSRLSPSGRTTGCDCAG